MLSCNQKTNKDSRQFENRIKTVVLSEDTVEFTIHTRNFYVYISTAEDLFNEKGYFIDKDIENQSLVNPILLSNIRSVIGKYNESELISMDASEIQKQIMSLSNSMTFETSEEVKYNIRFNAVFIEKLKPKNTK